MTHLNTNKLTPTIRGLLLKEVKASLGSRNFVSFTMYNMEQMFDLINGYGLLEHADFVHCMAYDNKGEHRFY